ncbi:hypothetical protein EJB05_50639, partial [Eragrostis curvula]
LSLTSLPAAAASPLQIRCPSWQPRIPSPGAYLIRPERDPGGGDPEGARSPATISDLGRPQRHGAILDEPRCLASFSTSHKHAARSGAHLRHGDILLPRHGDLLLHGDLLPLRNGDQLLYAKPTAASAVGLSWPGAAEVLLIVEDLKRSTVPVIEKPKELCAQERRRV